MIAQMIETLEQLQQQEVESMTRSRRYIHRGSRIAKAWRDVMESFIAVHKQHLQDVRLRNKLTQKQMAVLAAVPAAYISNVENGVKGRIKDLTLLRVLKTYKILEARDGIDGSLDIRAEGSESIDARS